MDGGSDGSPSDDQGIGDGDGGLSFFEDLGPPADGGETCTGSSCTGGQLCVQGACTCPTYQTLCNGHCIPVSVDPDNCGGCGVKCMATEACSAGKCSSSCLPGLTICDRACVDLNTDNKHCNSCTNSCPSGQGCVNGTCKPAVVVGLPPAKCGGGGPPITVPTSGTGVCAGNLAQTTFTWALCSCANVNISQVFTTDAFDSTKGPYTPGGLGGGVGLDGQLQTSSTTDVGGTLWASASGGLSASSALTVRQELHVGGDVSTHMCTVSDDAYIVGNASGSPLTIGGTLYQTPGATRTGVTAGSVVAKAVTVPTPCDCSAGALIPVTAIVTTAQTTNDNALIGLDAAVFTKSNPPQRLDLPCGSYYLSGIATSIPIAIVAHGHTALYIGGDVNVSSPIDITLDPTATLDIFVGGTMKVSQRLGIGSPNYPALSRTYVGSSTTLQFSSSAALATNFYDAAALVTWSAPVEVYGAVFAGDFKASQSVKIHYDRQVVKAGQDCPAPTPTTDAGTVGCKSCTDCNNQACISGSCGACTDDSQCCAPLRCSSGTCEFPIL
jgi:hypothetical protein